MISSNNNNITVEFKASPLERDLITTDRRELLDLLRRMEASRSLIRRLYGDNTHYEINTHLIRS